MTYRLSRTCILLSGINGLLLGGCPATTSDSIGSDTADAGNGNLSGASGGNAGNTAVSAELLVVDSDSGIRRFANALAISGDVPPTTALSFSRDTPLAVAVITQTGKLIVSYP